jgi:hypothetical protein
MIKMKLLNKIWLIFFLLGIHISVLAQTQEQYVYQDSSILQDAVQTDSIANSIAENATDELLKNYKPPTPADTLLIYNQLSVPPDSIGLLKKTAISFSETSLDSTLRALQKRAHKKEGDYSDNAKNNQSKSNFFSSDIFRIIIWCLAISFVLFVIFQLFFSEGIFLKKAKKLPMVMEQKEPDELDLKTDYEALKLKALNAGDYRMAVRYQYLNALQKLNNKSLLVFAPDKTNYQYVRELSGKPMGPAFARLTLEYEYVWFGKFELSPDMYQQINEHYLQFNQQL